MGSSCVLRFWYIDCCGIMLVCFDISSFLAIAACSVRCASLPYHCRRRSSVYKGLSIQILMFKFTLALLMLEIFKARLDRGLHMFIRGVSELSYRAASHLPLSLNSNCKSQCRRLSPGCMPSLLTGGRE